MHSLLLVKHKLLLALGSNPLHACSVISVPFLGARWQKVSLGSRGYRPVTGLDTQNPFSFPTLILWKIMFPGCSHALCDRGTRKGATFRRNFQSRQTGSRGHLPSLPFSLPVPGIGDGERGWLPLSFYLLFLPVPTLGQPAAPLGG